jgi:hypothetical protein
LDASNEALRDAVEDAPTNTSSTDIELVPVFDRAHRVPKI